MQMEDLTIATVPTEVNALFYIAEDQDFFASNGLRVTIKETFDSGASATAAMLKGEADIATATEFLITRQIFNHVDIMSFGTLAKYENTYMIWRADSGITAVKDLKGKRVGVPLQTIAEFYLGRMLDLNGISIKDVILVDTKAADSEKAVINREVDAVVTWEPFVTQINQRMGQSVVIKASQSSQTAFWNLVGTRNWTSTHPGTMERLLKSLAQAQDYLSGHQNEAKALIQKRLNLDEAYLGIVWQRYQFYLSLDQSLVTAMEDEARWLIVNNLTTEKVVPDYLEYIYEDALKKVKPGAVRIIR
jgi:NitT/TauT family transport system substrate-binding protein